MLRHDCLTPRLEALESRFMLATVTVDTAEDLIDGDASSISALIGAPGGDGFISLREAILAANETAGADDITFDVSLLGTSINLVQGEFEITEELSIRGVSARFTTIDAGEASRIFNITATSGDFFIEELTLTGGHVTDSPGGALHSESSGLVTITRSSVSGNSTSGDDAQGGGIWAAGDVSVLNSTISGNFTDGAGANGGGISSGGDVSFVNSTASGNSTNGVGANGGGIFANGNAAINNSTLFENSTAGEEAHGGGVFTDGNLTIFSSIVAGNSISGIASRGPDLLKSGLLQVNRSLIGDNAGVSLVESQTPDPGGNLIGSSSGSGIIDPLLGPLQNNGGPTPTHALLPDSPAIDRGSINPNGEISDQRGNPFFRRVSRLISSSPADMGSFEIQPIKPHQLIVTTQKDLVDGDVSSVSALNGDPGDDGLISLREAVLATNNTQGRDDIRFDSSLNGVPITLSIEGRDEDAAATGDLDITGELAIFGHNGIYDGIIETDDTIIDAAGIDRIFDVASTAGHVSISGALLTGGRTEGDGTAGSGGAIRSLSKSSLRIGSSISGNSTSGDFARGGGVFSSGNVSVSASIISENSTSGYRAEGGGIYSHGIVGLSRSIVSGNSTSGDFAYGGGISAYGDVRVSILRGVTHDTGSTVSGNSTSGRGAKGGGIFTHGYIDPESLSISGDVIITGSTVSSNSTSGEDASGGGISSFYDVILTNSTVSGNSTEGFGAVGGGIFAGGDVILNGNVRIPGNLVPASGTTVSGNSTAGEGGNGGGISALGDVNLVNSTVSGNSTEGNNSDGGGISTLRKVSLTGSAVSGNSTTGDYSFGGGISAAGNVSLIGSTASENSTTGDYAFGGGISSRSDVSLTNSTVSGNSTQGNISDSGGIFGGGDVSLTSSTVSGNSTVGEKGYGGGITAFDNVYLTNSTVSGNSTSGEEGYGGGISTRADVTIISSIVAGNSVKGPSVRGPDLSVFGTLLATHSLIGDNRGTLLTEAQTPDANGNLIGSSGGSGIIDPLLGPLTDNGGATETHDLLPGSPAIDAGSNLEILDFDQRGEPFLRIIGEQSDIGALEKGDIEFQPLTLLVTTTDDELDEDVLAGVFDETDLSLREAINLANRNIGADEIIFDASLADLPINLSLGELVIKGELSIQGLGAGQTTIDAGGASRIFNITADSGNIRLAGLTLTGGHTTELYGNGGAIRSLTSGLLTITGSSVSGNSTTGIQSNGGGIYAYGNISLHDSIISENSTGSRSNGGGIFARGDVNINSSSISGNFVQDSSSGGGIVSVGNVSLTSSTVSGNSTAGSGGGIFVHGDISLTGSTVSENSTIGKSSSGGGISALGDITISGSIVAGNSSGSSQGNDLSSFFSTISVDHSLIGDNSGTSLIETQTPDAAGNLIGSSAGSGIIDPMLGPLVDNGGPTLTHGLLPGSPAIDSGSNPLMLDFDQRGEPFPRVLGESADIGAFEGTVELHPLTLLVTTSDDELDLDAEFDSPDLSLREAIGLANLNPGPDEILFDNSLARIPINLGLGELVITGELSIKGLGTGRTVIDAGETTRIFNITAPSGDFLLDGMTLTGGRTIDKGGAIRSQSFGLLSINNSNITANSTTGSDSGGGGIYVRGDARITNSTISGNSNSELNNSDGGGILAFGNVILIGSVFFENSTGGSSSYGGGVFARGDVNLIDSKITGNLTRGSLSHGGGIFAFGDVSLVGSIVTENSIFGRSAHGGGISAIGSVSLVDSTVSENSTAREEGPGGGIYTLGNVNLAGSTVSGNSTSGDNSNGGGIFARGNVSLTNSTLSENSIESESAKGGGIYSSADLTIASSILAGNTDAGTTGLSPDLHSDGLLLVDHSLIGDSRGTSLTEAQTPDADGNLIGSSSGGGIIDPLLGPLTDNGGLTETHALLPDSPAIDAGSNPDEVQFDQRGDPFSRNIGAGPDMGSFELQDVQDIIGDSNRDGRFNVADILQVLVAGKYNTGESATWEEGDWNEDGFFNVFDIILALTEGNFEGGQQAAVLADNPTTLTSITSAKTVDHLYSQEETLSGQTIVDLPEILDSIEQLAVKRRR